MTYYGDDDDMESQLKYLDKLEQGIKIKQQRDFMAWRDKTISNEIEQAAKELGVSPEDLSRHMGHPSYEKDVRRATRKLVERAAMRMKAGKEEKAASSTQRRERSEPQRRGRPSQTDMDAMKARAQRGQLSDDELCDLLPRVIR